MAQPGEHVRMSSPRMTAFYALNRHRPAIWSISYGLLISGAGLGRYIVKNYVDMFDRHRPKEPVTSDMRDEGTGDQVAAIGDRCIADGHYGTIRFIGEVPPTEGIWYGVDWDDRRRGKHNGQKDGVTYFTTRHPTSGSFVRPKKVDLGTDVMAAVRERYGMVEDEAAGVHTDQMFVCGNKQRTTVEVVGAKSVNLHQSQFEKLSEVALRGLPISRAGQPGMIAATLKNVSELDISDSLISTWTEVAKITSQLKNLRTLNVSDNVIAVPTDKGLQQADFSQIWVLFINRCHLTWPEFLQLGAVMTSLKSVHACFNQITAITPVNGLLPNLTTLNLEANSIASWEDVLNLSGLASLETLILNSTGIDKIEFSDVQPGNTTKYFPRLKALSLFRNKISEWSSIDELNKLAQFEDLKLRFNPLVTDTKESEETIRSLFIAKIGKLRLCNRTEVTPEERNGAEIDYLRKFGKEWRASGGHQKPEENRPNAEFTRNHPRYQACIDAHGACEDEELVVKSSALKDNLLAVSIDCPQLPEKAPLNKKLPTTMTLQKLKAMVQRIFKADPSTLQLTYTSTAQPDQQFDLDNDMRELGYFGLQNGDVIHVKY